MYFKNIFKRFNWWVRGILWYEVDAEGGSITLYKTGWIVDKDKDGVCDALPITYCSQKLVDRIEKDLEENRFFKLT